SRSGQLGLDVDVELDLAGLAPNGAKLDLDGQLRAFSGLGGRVNHVVDCVGGFFLEAGDLLEHIAERLALRLEGRVFEIGHGSSWWWRKRKSPRSAGFRWRLRCTQAARGGD